MKEIEVEILDMSELNEDSFVLIHAYVPSTASKPRAKKHIDHNRLSDVDRKEIEVEVEEKVESKTIEDVKATITEALGDSWDKEHQDAVTERKENLKGFDTARKILENI